MSGSSESLTGYPAAPGQLGLWRLIGDRCRGPVCAQAAIRAATACDALAAAMEMEAAALEMLHVRLCALPGMADPLQVLDAGPPLAIDQRAYVPVETVMAAHRVEPFDPGTEPPLRVTLMNEPGHGAVAVLTVSTLHADATSLARFAVRARDRALGRPRQVEDAPSFIDVAGWLRDRSDERTGDPAAPARDRGHLPEAIHWPRAHPAPPAGPFRPFRLPVALTAEAIDALVGTAAILDAPPGAVALAAWAALRERWGRSDGGLSVSVSGRTDVELDRCFGSLAHAATIRLDISAGLRFDEFARSVNNTLARAEKGQADAGVMGERTFPAFSFQDLTGHAGVEALRGIDGGFAIRLTLSGLACAPELAIEADASVFAGPDAQSICEQYAHLLGSAVLAPERRLRALPLMSHRSRTLLRPAVVRSAARGSWIERLHGIVREMPQRRALVNPEGHAMSYEALWRRAVALRPALVTAGAGPERLVAIAANEPDQQVTAIVAAAVVGAGFCVIDPSEPAARHAEKLRRLAPAAVLADGEALGWLSGAPGVIALGTGIAPVATDEPPTRHDPATLAYVCFTSGSTGRQKGVAVEHRQLSAYLDGIAKALPLASCRSMAAVTTPAADLGHTALFGALTCGAALTLIAPDDARDPHRIGQIFAAARPDLLKITPSHLASLLAVAGSDVLPRRCLVLGGEAIRPVQLAALRRAAPELTIVNHYGPTETTVGVLVRILSAEDAARPDVPLSDTLTGTSIRALDRNMLPMPKGVRSELAVAGETVARGYLRQPVETAACFRPDPESDRPGARCYMTGDLARWAADGSVVICGRADRQIGLRGIRIEPGEVEAAVRAAPGIADALVTLRGAGDESLLVAYARRDPAAQSPADANAVRAALAERLPSTIWPQAIVLVDDFPMTTNGKLDLARLPEVTLNRGGGPAAPMEEVVADVWGDLLGGKSFGMEDNFFDLGGHSLLLIEMQGKLHQRLGVDLPILELFRHTTVRALAARIASGEGRATENDTVVRAAARAARRRTALPSGGA